MSGIFLGAALVLLLCIALKDIQTKCIPDALSIPFIIVAALHGFVTGPIPWLPALIGGGFFVVQWTLSRGAWVGSGDILLGFGIGLLMGNYQLLLVALGVAYIVGAIAASYLLLTKNVTRKSTLPFGPFLAAGAVIAMIFGERILLLMGF